MTTEFWNQQHNDRLPQPISPATFLLQSGRLEQELYRCCGSVAGKRVLDLGCGAGEQAVLLAKLGAVVTAVDLSPVAVQQTRRLAELNGVAAGVQAIALDAMELERLGRTFDLIVGKYILHHIEPFDCFAPVLYRALAPGGRAVFIENNARNPILMFARNYLAGRLGIPKYGDDQEHPLEAREIAVLEKVFDRVELLFPEFVFLRKLNTYVFRQKQIFTPLMWALARLDDLVHRYCPAARPFSYDQVVVLNRASAACR